MPIRFPCTACGQLLGIATRKVGTEIHCPTCGLAVIVPDEAQAKLLRHRARQTNKPSFPSPDTPPEISIPREQQAAFDDGLASFLTQLDVSPVASKPLITTVSASVKAPPPKPVPSTAPATSVTPQAKTPATSGNGVNGTHAVPARPPVPPPPPAAKPTAAPVVAPAKQSPADAPVVEIPLAFEDHEVSVLSAGDLLELAEEPPAKPLPPPSAKIPPPPPKQNPPVAKPVAVPPTPTVAVPSIAPPPPVPPATSANPRVPEFAAVVESIAPPATDLGFDFSTPVMPSGTARKSETAAKTLAIAVPSSATIPPAPFDNAVWISRRAIYTHVVILVLVSVVTFLIGWISGGAGSQLPSSSNAGPVRFEALIQYMAANGKTLPDDGAVVLLWPKQAKPLERLSSKRLSPAEPAPPADHPTLKALETLRGAYARANAQGEIRDLLLAEPGEYYVLVISRNLARPPQEQISDKALPILGDLFGGEALNLLGTRQFTLKVYTIADTRTLNHTFGAPAEAK